MHEAVSVLVWMWDPHKVNLIRQIPHTVLSGILKCTLHVPMEVGTCK